MYSQKNFAYLRNMTLLLCLCSKYDKSVRRRCKSNVTGSRFGATCFIFAHIPFLSAGVFNLETFFSCSSRLFIKTRMATIATKLRQVMIFLTTVDIAWMPSMVRNETIPRHKSSSDCLKFFGLDGKVHCTRLPILSSSRFKIFSRVCGVNREVIVGRYQL